MLVPEHSESFDFTNGGGGGEEGQINAQMSLYLVVEILHETLHSPGDRILKGTQD
jgi:hypothetical protein